MLPIQLVVRLSSSPLDWFVCLFVCLFVFFHQNWSPEEKEQNSTCREPKAVCLALEAFAGRLSHARVIWYSNNQNVESAMSQRQQEIGSAGVNFQALQICPKYHISLDAGWIPKGLNVIADFISNLVDFDDYAINDFVFRVLMTTAGDRIPPSGSPVVTKPHCQGLFPGFLSPAVRQLAPVLRSWDTTITVCPVSRLSNCQTS